MTALQILNLSRNKIQFVEDGAFDNNHNLQAIRLDGNLLKDITGMFTRLPNLGWLNVSDHQLEFFDYAMIPVQLQWLDLHANRITQLFRDRGSIVVEHFRCEFQSADRNHWQCHSEQHGAVVLERQFDCSRAGVHVFQEAEYHTGRSLRQQNHHPRPERLANFNHAAESITSGDEPLRP